MEEEIYLQHLMVLVLKVNVVDDKEIGVVAHFDQFAGDVKEDKCLLDFFLEKDNCTYHAPSPSNSSI